MNKHQFPTMIVADSNGLRFISYLIISCSFVFLTVALVQAAGIDASLDRNRVVEGDSLTLSLVAPGDSQDSPDLSPLAQDFEVTSQAQSTSMTIINGSGSSTHEWRLVLMPKHAGDITLPKIYIGSLSSEPIAIKVLPANQAEQLNSARPVLVEVEADLNKLYVQSQVIYTVRILSRVPMQQASLTEPKAADTILERLGDDKSYKLERDGQSYNVIERRYALFPQHSGILSVESPVLKAMTPESGGRSLVLRDPFFGMPFGDPFGNLGSPFTHQVQVRGNNLTLEVKPQPVGSKSPWLPAASLQLRESWSPDPPNFKVGEPVTRTFTVVAKGLSAAQLPELEVGLPDGIKAYSDKAQGENQAQDDGMVATKVFKYALVPTRSGELILPEVRLAWWDTKINSLQLASIQAHKWEVKPALEPDSTNPTVTTTTGHSTASAAPADSTTSHQQQSPVVLTRKEQLPTYIAKSSIFSDVNYWMGIAAALGIAWLVTLALWLWESRSSSNKQILKLRSAPVNLSAAKSKVKHSCYANDARAAKAALLEWGTARWPEQPPKRLDAMATRLDCNASNILQELDRHLYAATPTSWDGRSAWQVLALALVADVSKYVQSPLPPLYPDAHSPSRITRVS